MGLPVRENSPENSPSAMPSATASNGVPKIDVSNGDGESNGAPFSANDNIRRFAPPSRALSPSQNALFHNKTRCFV
jgi:hypothetical protein